MKSKAMILALSAAIALPAAAQATQIEAVSSSVFSVKASSDTGGKTASIIALGEPAKEKPKAKRTKRIGFVATVPPPPNAEDDAAIAPAPAKSETVEAGQMDPAQTADAAGTLTFSEDDGLRGGLEPLPANATNEEMQLRLQ